MHLEAGQRLGPYEILVPLGAGGMGEVYEARDTRLGRTVAIKVLPERLVEDPERLARFEREARTISRLSHPHVCALFDVGEQDGIHFLVLEHLEGTTLARRLQDGPLPMKDALRFSSEIAAALGAAHRQGVVHRDLKPANVMLTPAGVKLLDFGLARVATGSREGLTHLPTVPMQAADPLTAEGTVLGTFPYMSPEQVEGHEADFRSDLFSFGALLYEMTTGRRAFPGESAASVMAAVLRSEPEPMTISNPATSPALDHVVSRCLAKDPEERWQSATDVAAELRWVADSVSRPNGRRLDGSLTDSAEIHSASPSMKGAGRREFLAWTLAAVALVLAAIVLGRGWLRHEEPTSPRQRISFTVPPPDSADFVDEVNSLNLALSPDGSILAVVVAHEDTSMVALRHAGDSQLRPVTGTEGAMSPFWSPDGRSLGFFAGGTLKRIPVSGGPSQTICPVEGQNTGAWAPDGTIVFTQTMVMPGGIFRVPSSGGKPAPLIEDDSGLGGRWPRFPHVLPDGRRVLFHEHHKPSGETMVAVADLDTGEARVLFPSRSRVAYDPGSGRLLYVVDGTLVARPFDLETLRLAGDPLPIAEDLPTFVTGWSPFAVSAAGVVAHRSGRRLVDLVWRDRTGREIRRAGVPGTYVDFALAPDEKRAVVEAKLYSKGESDLWLIDLERGTRQRLTSLAGSESAPTWSPDGREILFAHHGSTLADAPEGVHRLVLGSGDSHRLSWTDQGSWDWVSDWSENGDLLYIRYFGEKHFSLWIASLDDEEPSPSEVVPSSREPGLARWSPDGQWVAYASGSSRPQEIFVTRTDGRETATISAGGAIAPRWRGDGRAIFYLTLDRKVAAAHVDLGETASVQEIEELFPTPDRIHEEIWDASSDGQRFLFLEKVGDPVPVTVTIGWR